MKSFLILAIILVGCGGEDAAQQIAALELTPTPTVTATAVPTMTMTPREITPIPSAQPLTQSVMQSAIDAPIPTETPGDMNRLMSDSDLTPAPTYAPTAEPTETVPTATPEATASPTVSPTATPVPFVFPVFPGPGITANEFTWVCTQQIARQLDHYVIVGANKSASTPEWQIVTASVSNGANLTSAIQTAQSNNPNDQIGYASIYSAVVQGQNAYCYSEAL
jgi:hypothetical protein